MRRIRNVVLVDHRERFSELEVKVGDVFMVNKRGYMVYCGEVKPTDPIFSKEGKRVIFAGRGLREPNKYLCIVTAHPDGINIEDGGIRVSSLDAGSITIEMGETQDETFYNYRSYDGYKKSFARYKALVKKAGLQD